MAISSMDTLVAAMTASTAQVLTWHKSAITADAAGTYSDLFFAAGNPGAGQVPAAASVGGTSYSGTADAGLVFTPPIGGQLTYVLSWSVGNSLTGTVMLYDRLWACSGLATGAGATTTITGMTPVTRYNGGEGALLWYVCFVAPGAQPSGLTITASYTNSDGVSGRTGSIVMSAGAPPVAQYQAYPFTLQAGDKGVQSVQSVTNSVAAFTGGSHGLMICKTLMSAPCPIGSNGILVDGLKMGLPQIDDDASLNFMMLAGSANTGYWTGTITLVQG
jgi:hypothetical protein